MSLDDRFYASVSQGTLNKVTRLFNATLGDVFQELLQNARRAGASRVLVTREQDPDGNPFIAVQDDGRGVASPQTLFTLGDSGWDPSTERSEDPAGMGVFALSPRGCSIQSKTADAACGWTTHVRTAHFKGDEEIAVLETADLPFEHGTRFVFPYDAARESVDRQLGAAAHYYPLPVLLDGEPLQQEDFLRDAIYREQWHGIEIGVRRLNGWSANPTINFFGVTVAEDLAVVHEVRGGRYEVRLNIVDSPELQLVLPARKEVVHGAFFDELKTAGKRAIFRAIAARPVHSLSYADWTAARELGVDLPEAAAELTPYTPPCADANTRYSFGWANEKAASVPERALLIDFRGDPPHHQMLWRALENASLGYRPLEPVEKFKGYAWYDRLPQLKEIGFSTENGGVRFDDLAIDDPNEGRPTKIEIELTIETADASKTPLSETLSTDVLLTGESYAYSLDDIGVQVTADSEITPTDLAEFLEAAYFSPSDDTDADSYETQRDAFRAQAEDLATRLLVSEEAANNAAILRAVNEHVVWLLPRNAETVIRIKGREVELDTTRLDDGAGGYADPN